MASSRVSYESVLQGSRVSLDTDGTAHNEDDFKNWKPGRRCISLYHISAVNACLLLVVIFLLMWSMARNWSGPKHEGHFIERSYGSNEQYMSLDHQYDFLWASPAIRKAGVIGVSWDNEGTVTEIGAISMFHQLHCLVAFRRALQKAYEGEKVAFDFHEDQHWPHCLYYLREAIICQADAQIEEQQIRNGSRPSVDGSGDLRKCRDADKLFDLYHDRHVS